MVEMSIEERRAKNAAYMREWNARNREHVRQSKREATARNPQANRDRVAQWQKANPDRVRASAIRVRDRDPDLFMAKRILRFAKERAARRGVVIQLEVVRPSEIAAKTNGACGICGEPVTNNLAYDHIEPICRGGSHTLENLQLTHNACNARKDAHSHTRCGRAANSDHLTSASYG